jgi:hypothetical protein
MLQNGPIQACGSPYLGTAQPRDKQKLTPVAEPHQLSLLLLLPAFVCCCFRSGERDGGGEGEHQAHARRHGKSSTATQIPLRFDFPLFFCGLMLRPRWLVGDQMECGFMITPKSPHVYSVARVGLGWVVDALVYISSTDSLQGTEEGMTTSQGSAGGGATAGDEMAAEEEQVVVSAETEENVQRILLAIDNFTRQVTDNFTPTQADGMEELTRPVRAGVGDAGDRPRAVQGPGRRLRGPPLLVRTNHPPKTISDPCLAFSLTH